MFLISTPQRCGSTWLTRMLCGMAGSRDVYMNGLEMGFRPTAPHEPGAIEKLAQFFSQHPKVSVFKTHDVPARDFDAVCAALPELRVLTLHRDFRDTVVSRYFHLRHYWPTDPSLGLLPPPFAQFLAEMGDAPDGVALTALFGTEMVRSWAGDWGAFEGRFSTQHAIRLSYTGMLDGSDFPRLAQFTGLPLCSSLAFKTEQEQETLNTGRNGMVRFNRKGQAGEWREWFTEEQGARLDAMAGEAAMGRLA